MTRYLKYAEKDVDGLNVFSIMKEVALLAIKIGIGPGEVEFFGSDEGILIRAEKELTKEVFDEASKTAEPGVHYSVGYDFSESFGDYMAEARSVQEGFKRMPFVFPKDEEQGS